MLQFGLQKKTISSSQNGDQHLFMIIELTRMLSPDVRNIVYPVIQRNALNAHPENIFLHD